LLVLDRKIFPNSKKERERERERESERGESEQVVRREEIKSYT
jgi:hypothetical protein